MAGQSVRGLGCRACAAANPAPPWSTAGLPRKLLCNKHRSARQRGRSNLEHCASPNQQYTARRITPEATPPEKPIALRDGARQTVALICEGESEQAAEPHATDEDPERCRGDQVIARNKPRAAEKPQRGHRALCPWHPTPRPGFLDKYYWKPDRNLAIKTPSCWGGGGSIHTGGAG